VYDYKERVYILHIFELAFSSDEHQKDIYLKMTDWETKRNSLPRILTNLTGEISNKNIVTILTLQKWHNDTRDRRTSWRDRKQPANKKIRSTAMNAYRMRIDQVIQDHFDRRSFP
jgi:hypothetical protein